MSDVAGECSSGQQMITVLGSTGSIGVSTLDVVARHLNKFSVFALTANTNVDMLERQCLSFAPAYAVMQDEASANVLRQRLSSANINTEVLAGSDALVSVANDNAVDTVMAAIVGAAGLLPTLAAVKADKKVLLANKEALVMAGSLFMNALSQSRATLLPIDSEHNAIFQCLPNNLDQRNSASYDMAGVKKVLLTGSGGPFREWSSEAIEKATPDQACNHPNWSMGRKISVDSASLMNKGLEFIEARWLFGLSPNNIEVVIHPQSIIHSMVEYNDGSVLAQMGQPDMRTPIAHALAWPVRIESGVESLDFMSLNGLDFERPDLERFPALSLAMSAASQPSSAATVLNAANEIAVDAFLNGAIGFGQIITVLESVLASANFIELDSIDAVIDADLYARKMSDAVVASL